MQAENLAHSLEPPTIPPDEVITRSQRWSVVRLAKRVGCWMPSSRVGARTPCTGARWEEEETKTEYRKLAQACHCETRLVAICAEINITVGYSTSQWLNRCVEPLLRGRKEGAKWRCTLIARLMLCIDVLTFKRGTSTGKYRMKVYRSHTAAQYTRCSAPIELLHSLAHCFLKAPDQFSKLQLGEPGYELSYAVSGVLPYLLSFSSPLRSNSEAVPFGRPFWRKPLNWPWPTRALSIPPFCLRSSEIVVFGS